MKKFLAAFAAMALAFSAASAQTLSPPSIAAKSWLLLDATSNQVVASQDADLRVEPASLTKIMTAYLAFAAVRDKKLSLTQTVNVSVDAWKVDPSSSKMFIEPNKPVSIDNLLFGLITVSGNDAAVAVAEAVAGSVDAFVNQMNQEGQRMGLRNTHYTNPHGLPDPANYTTARDLSVLANRLINDFPQFYKTYYSAKKFTYNNITQPNRNRLLWLDPTVDGMKTGHTESAGYSMITSARRQEGNGERRLISVIVGTTSDQVRTQESQKLLNWGFQNFDAVKLYAKDQAIDTPKVWKGAQSQVKIGFRHDVYVTVPKGSATKVKPTLTRNDPLMAPLAENAKVGTMKVSLDGNVILEVPVVALEQVSQASIFGRAWDSLRLLFK
ncbi:D-alanyl-D-alanine carboxypeptidase family protein [Herbaspirillum sp. RTI4]|uniref:D-alanyl-D-alanine carboxypeptidase family protein n=1 Tax=Herbaspirillum sp. RTI4 TaxID=3048640 RepID=UPI002AB4CC12|nr:D-alanyl-D-alanine carboxypeptidase family protein [Herbaspirillum sp. RTI4]MDY7576947.1 D-alanyl-D-alanine carboxypeptidase family protein [Herbaspirillum sp. RTI4]MEA9982151.1 D-alanyl-D-alanine carboxypeptidase family protein [Herbaspirillum sp. RTI4]